MSKSTKISKTPTNKSNNAAVQYTSQKSISNNFKPALMTEQGSMIVIPAPTDFSKLIKPTPFAKFNFKKRPSPPKLPLRHSASVVVEKQSHFVHSEPCSPVSHDTTPEKSYESIKTIASEKNTPRSILKRGGKSRFSFHTKKSSKYKRQQSSTQVRVKIIEGYY